MTSRNEFSSRNAVDPVRFPRLSATPDHAGIWILALVCLLCVPTMVPAQTATEWSLRANEQYEAGLFAESAESYEQSIEAGASSSTTYYNAACSSALAGRTDAALDHLDEAVSLGWHDVQFLESDEDLKALYLDPRWAEVVAHCQQAQDDFLAAIENPMLRAELLEMERIDQAVRRGEDVLGLVEGEMLHIDAQNTERMRDVVAENGWPGKRLVGRDGARAAWLLVQHADAQPGFQRECLELMLLAPTDDVSAIDVAYLTDRVLVNEGSEQVYGTQFWTVDGELVPRPIEDEADVEARRAEIGMISMKEYREVMTGQP